eukprot:jgi/Tetstr1/464762/TSEL_009509.t1
MREAWGRLQAAIVGHLCDADARVMERQAERILFNQLDTASGMWTVSIPTAHAFRDHCVHDRGIAIHHEVDDLFKQGVTLCNTVPRDELKDLVPDAELSLPAFNVGTGNYDPRSLKPTLVEFKTIQYGVKDTAVPRVTAVDRFERSLPRDIERGSEVRDAAWHNTEPGQKGPFRDIMDMSE